MRIVSLAPSNTEILFALGLQKDIVAVTCYCDFPKAVRAKPQVGSWINPKVDEIKKLQPDLILTSTIVQQKLARNLCSLGLPLVHLNPTTIKGIYESIAVIGTATSNTSKAKMLIDSLRQKLDQPTSPYNRKPKVYIEEWHQPPFVSGNWVPELVELAGGRYDLMRPGQLSRAVTVNEITAYDPDIMVLSICGFGKNVSKDIITKRKDWENLTAVKNGNVFTINDTYLNRPGPRIYQAVTLLRRYVARATF